LDKEYSPNKSTELEGGSPSLNKSANLFEAFTIQAFSEHVGPLFLSINLDDCDGAVANVRSKEMSFNLEVLRPIGNSLVGRQKKCTVVVFEHTTLDGRCKSIRKLQAINEFKEHGSQREKRSHGGAEG
jgi:hypothetical protein